ncbi:hypothetical protein HELRODRAFT_163998 [Helobdella robusta]|uniref:Uncharacterized protein n=1 Tax=Helobdella robusta TaxID=6412 RepID=T1EUQ7_HELRO|nr:hypothetical protein HELRODRAFT_163998 [Helobdella robusta]ESN94201.1 hypothetical protein HELRODRAFT_163998 [Helobdella robusta]
MTDAAMVVLTKTRCVAVFNVDAATNVTQTQTEIIFSSFLHLVHLIRRDNISCCLAISNGRASVSCATVRCPVKSNICRHEGFRLKLEIAKSNIKYRFRHYSIAIMDPSYRRFSNVLDISLSEGIRKYKTKNIYATKESGTLTFDALVDQLEIGLEIIVARLDVREVLIQHSNAALLPTCWLHQFSTCALCIGDRCTFTQVSLFIHNNINKTTSATLEQQQQNNVKSPGSQNLPLHTCIEFGYICRTVKEKVFQSF